LFDNDDKYRIILVTQKGVKLNSVSSTSRTRFIIPISEELREDVLDFAKENKLKIAELGRKLFEDYVKAEKRRRRHEELRQTMIEY